jgi:hypothetical protein
VDEGREQRRALDHRGVDLLAAARRARLEQRAADADAEGQEHAAAPEVGVEVQRREGPLAGAADGTEHPGRGDVVDVVPATRESGPSWP